MAGRARLGIRRSVEPHHQAEGLEYRIASDLGVHPQTIGYLERSQYSTSLALALRIAQFFELPVEAVFSLDPLQPLSQHVYGRTT